VIRQNLPGSGVASIDDAAHFLVDQLRGITGYVRLLAASAASQKNLSLFLGVHQRTELLRKAPLGHHVTSQLRSAHDVVGCAGRYTVEAQRHFLGDTATEQRADLTDQSPLGKTVTV